MAEVTARPNGVAEGRFAFQPALNTWIRPVAEVAFRVAVRDERWMTDRRSPDQFIPPGTAVRHDGLGSPEYGVVVHCWLNPEIAMHDCYVAFFGSELPTGKPDEKPYILRYAAVSLTRLDVS